MFIVAGLITSGHWQEGHGVIGVLGHAGHSGQIVWIAPDT